MSKEVIFVIEPDTGRTTLESSQVTGKLAKEIKQALGRGISLNCGRPNLSATEENSQSDSVRQNSDLEKGAKDEIYLFRLYHRSTVDGPGRRSVIQVAGCSIRCPGCYVPETHRREKGKLTGINEIVREIDKRSGEHDGVTILGGEPFDQTESLESLVIELKKRNYHLTIYTGYPLGDLRAREDVKTGGVLKNTDLLIDGAFNKHLADSAGEYRGSSNQKLIYQPLLYEKK